jgi:hypothetical protein
MSNMQSYIEDLESLFVELVQVETELLCNKDLRRNRRKKLKSFRNLLVENVLLATRLMLLDHGVVVDADFNLANP